MDVQAILSELSIAHWLIVGFIGANLGLMGAYLLQCGVRRTSASNR